MSVQVCCWPCPSKYFHVATFAFSSAASGVVQIQPYTGSFSRFAPSPSFFFFLTCSNFNTASPSPSRSTYVTGPSTLAVFRASAPLPFFTFHLPIKMMSRHAWLQWSCAAEVFPPLSIWEWIDRSIDLAHKWHLTNILSFRVVLISCWPTLLRRYMKNSYLLSDPSKAAGW